MQNVARYFIHIVRLPQVYVKKKKRTKNEREKRKLFLNCSNYCNAVLFHFLFSYSRVYIFKIISVCNGTNIHSIYTGYIFFYQSESVLEL